MYCSMTYSNNYTVLLKNELYSFIEEFKLFNIVEEFCK